MNTLTKEQIVASFGNFHEVMQPTWIVINDCVTGHEKEVASPGDIFSCWGNVFRIAGNITSTGEVSFIFDEI